MKIYLENIELKNACSGSYLFSGTQDMNDSKISD